MHRATTLTTWETHRAVLVRSGWKREGVLAMPSVFVTLLLVIVGVALFDEECANLFPS